MKNQEFYIDCNNMKVHAKLDFPEGYEWSEDGKQEKLPVLVIIPGLTGHIEEDHIIGTKDAALECGYAVIRSELYGHGKSDGEYKNHDVLIWMHQAMQVVDYALSQQFTKDVIISGHSQGGLTSVLVAGMMADKIKAAMPLSPALNIWDGARNGQLFSFKFDVNNVPDVFDCDGPLLGNYLRAAAMLPVEEAVARFNKPVYLVHGTADSDVPYSWSEWLLERYSDVELVPIEGDDHCYTMHLDKVLEAEKVFLRKMAD